MPYPSATHIIGNDDQNGGIHWWIQVDDGGGMQTRPSFRARTFITPRYCMV